MTLAYRFLFPAMWLSWLAYWWAVSRRAKPTERKEPLAPRLLHVVPLSLAVAILLADRLPWAPLNERVFPWAPWEFWAAAAATAAGLLFTAWARVHLGRNWSAMVTLKQEHELITTGPYAIVRHPIYTGLLVAFIGSAVVLGEWRSLLAVVLALAALWRKLQVEELWMVERFGEEYAAYARRVPALVPFWP
jgi:protein-S-isoprenylcysteine O-methyltransferase Ste14